MSRWPRHGMGYTAGVVAADWKRAAQERRRQAAPRGEVSDTMKPKQTPAPMPPPGGGKPKPKPKY